MTKPRKLQPLKTQLLKWVGNKQKQAFDIISFFPKEYDTYFEPFLGSGAILGTLAPEKAIASDIFKPLMEIWDQLIDDPEILKKWYSDRYQLVEKLGKKEAYSTILKAYNERPNGADFVFIIRACYGGVVRFRKKDGYMSTPCGAHNPMPPTSFAKRVDLWHERLNKVTFKNCDFSDAMDLAKKGDLIYCDPPYLDSQTILYGAQEFSFQKLINKIQECKDRGVYVALSIDGTKLSGNKICDVEVPEDLFKQEVFICVGRSMLKRFQMEGQDLKDHVVTDRLLLTY